MREECINLMTAFSIAVASKPDAVSEFKEKQTAVRQTLPKGLKSFLEESLGLSTYFSRSIQQKGVLYS